MASTHAINFWKLYDADQKIFYNDLDLGQLQIMINDIPSTKMASWHVSKDGGEDWFPLKYLLKEIIKKTSTPEKANTEILEIVGFNTFVKTATGFQSTKTKEVLKRKKGVERRKMRRMSKKVKVLIDVGDQILEANTKDISILGIKLDEKFPLHYKGHSYSLIVKAKPPFELRCTPLVSEPDHIKGYWNRVKIHPGFNLNALVIFLEKQ